MPQRKLGEIVEGQILLAVRPSDPVSIVAGKMKDHGVGAVLILEGDELKGIFTLYNLLNSVFEAGLDPKQTEVREVMTTNPVCLDCDAKGFEAVRLMREHNTRHIVVSDTGEHGYHVVSVKDFPKSELREFEEELELEQRIWDRL
ncbi:CBS domain-containing protein [Alphaproteobacteria bacterium HT1-32]|nr:CBS domain-containing protein [Alphaproteobacteria bacterium HT1-32]